MLIYLNNSFLRAPSQRIELFFYRLKNIERPEINQVLINIPPIPSAYCNYPSFYRMEINGIGPKKDKKTQSKQCS